MVNKKIQEKAIEVEKGLNKHFKGSKELVDVFLAGIFSKSNILLWASHGKGKSFLAETTAKLSNTSYGRVQGGSGLTQSKAIARYDVGKLLKGEEEVKWRDFIFARIKLLDEVNRVHPTLLNDFFTMLAERIIIFGDKRQNIPNFTFIATMNPADSGTYELPAPFWDRFDICVLLPSIRFSDKLDIISGAQNGVKAVLKDDTEIEEIWKDVETVEVPRDVKVLLISLTRDLQLCIYGEKEFITNFPQCCEECRFKEFICSKLDNRFPISERFYLSVVKVAKAYAYLNGREKISIDDVLVIAKYGLYHRAKFTPTFEQKWFSKQLATDKIVEQLSDKNVERKDAWKIIKAITDGDVGKLKDLEKWWIDNDLLIKEIYEELKTKIDEKKAVVSSKLSGKTPEELQRILDSDVDPEIKKEAMELLDKHLAVMAEIPVKKYPKFLAQISNISQPMAKYLRGYYTNGGGVPNGEFSSFDDSKFSYFMLDLSGDPENITLTVRTKSIDTQREMEQLFKSINIVFKKIGA